MRLVFLGPPGAGKGSVAQRILDTFGIIQISAGDLLRNSVKKGAPLGKKAKSFMEKGELVPDQLVIDLILQRIELPDALEGFILDGFPRTIAQAEALEKAGVKIDKVVNFLVPDDLIIKRISGRRMHRVTGEIYNIHTLPPPKGTKEEDLIQRADDKPEAVKNRLKVYQNQTSPLIDYYDKKGLLVDINGARELDKVVKDTVKLIGKH